MRWLVLTFALAASGCVVSNEPYNVAWKEGSSQAKRNADITDCEVQALRKVPQAMTVNTTPVFRTPSNVQCTRIGNFVNCQDYGGQVYGGQTYTSDANEDLRYRVTSQCLAQRGYQIVSMPRCTQEQLAKGQVARASVKMPPISSVLCLSENGYVFK